MEKPVEVYREYLDNKATQMTMDVQHPKFPNLTIKQVYYMIVPYIDYRSDGLKLEGEEDFSPERWAGNHGKWWIWTPMGKLDRGGHRRWDCRRLLCARNAKEARKIAEMLYPDQEISLRKF